MKKDNMTDEERRKAEIVKEICKIDGVGETTASTIYDAGFFTLMDIAVSPLGTFMDKTGIGKSAAEKIKASAMSLAKVGSAKSLEDLEEEENTLVRYPTGSDAFNQLLGGGYPSQLITEICSQNGIGKTQSVITASVMAMCPVEKGGMGKDVVFLDTEGTFTSSRLKGIATARGIEWDEIKGKFIYVRVTSSSHQLYVMNEIREIAKDRDVGLIVCDSIITHFRAEYVGRGVLAERQQLLGSFIADLRNFAISNNCAVIITNQVEAVPDGFAFGPSWCECGGHVLGHSCAVRVQIRKGQAGKRILSLKKSPWMPDGECVVLVGQKGLCDK